MSKAVVFIFYFKRGEFTGFPLPTNEIRAAFRVSLFVGRPDAEPDQLRLRPFLRACLLESVRLWPTTPTILRDTTEDTTWRDGTVTIEKGAGLMIVTPAYHRDPALLPFANDFVPDIWLDGRARSYPQLVPFSAGPAECPGRNLVLFATSTLLGNLLSRLDFRLSSMPQLSPDEPLPVTLNQYGVEFTVQPVTSSTASSLPS